MNPEARDIRETNDYLYLFKMQTRSGREVRREEKILGQKIIQEESRRNIKNRLLNFLPYLRVLFLKFLHW